MKRELLRNNESLDCVSTTFKLQGDCDTIISARVKDGSFHLKMDTLSGDNNLNWVDDPSILNNPAII